MKARNLAWRMASGFVSGFVVDRRANIAALAAACGTSSFRQQKFLHSHWNRAVPWGTGSNENCTIQWAPADPPCTVRADRVSTRQNCSVRQKADTQTSESSSSGLPQRTGRYPPTVFALLEAVAVPHQANLRSALVQSQHLPIACNLGVSAGNCAAELNPTDSQGRPRQSPLPHDLVAGPVFAVLMHMDPHQSQHWSHCPDFHAPHSAQRASSEAHPNDPASPQSKVQAALHQWHVVCACVERKFL